MGLLLRNFILLLALVVASSSPAMAKEETKKGKSKSGLSLKKPSTKKTTKKPKVAKKAKKARAVRSERAVPEGKLQYKDTIVNINKATAAAMASRVPGIGPVKATAIVAYRKKNGKFKSLKDLMNVVGIGEATFDGLKANVSTSRGKTVAPEGYVMEEVTAKPKNKRAKKRSTNTPNARDTSKPKKDRVTRKTSDSRVSTTRASSTSSGDKKLKKKKKVVKKAKKVKKKKTKE